MQELSEIPRVHFITEVSKHKDRNVPSPGHKREIQERKKPKLSLQKTDEKRTASSPSGWAGTEVTEFACQTWKKKAAHREGQRRKSLPKFIRPNAILEGKSCLGCE